MSTYGLAPFSLDPVGPAAGDSRVFRGGSWYNNARQIEAANHRRGDRPDRGSAIGFRLARSVS
jgi:formylglycine-generating enzyme required for sulfatase activity